MSLRLLCLALLLPPSLAPAAAPPRGSFAFTHVTLIAGTGAPPASDRTVAVSDGRIVSVGPSRSTAVPAGATAIDGTGKFLIPGLWDMHVHLLWDPAIDSGFRLCIANGVTGVRDMHTHIPFEQIHRWQAEVADGRRVGPRFVYAGPILDGPNPIWPGSLAVADAAAGRDSVRRVKAGGASFVKVYERLPREAYFAIADECKKQGIPFVGHVPESITPAEASAAGQHTIEHLSHCLEKCSTGSSVGTLVYDPVKGKELFEVFKRNHTWNCPTLIVAQTTTLGREDRYAKDPRRKYLPQSVLSKVGFDDSHRDWDATLHYWKEERKLMRQMHEAGVELLAGTDTPIVRNVPGFTLHDELMCLVESGLTPIEAIQAATRNPARCLGLEKELGTVEAGKRADLVLLGADPLADIHNTTRIEAVVADGRLYDRRALDSLLQQLETDAKTDPR
jgi:hypothetical protein